jgi:hypothetical protein
MNADFDMFRGFEFFRSFRMFRGFPFMFFPLNLGNLVITALVAYLLYKDAEKRGMNGLLWALLAVFAPTLIVAIIYLFVRKNPSHHGHSSDLRCSGCNNQVSPDWNVCPYCQQRLK